MTRIFFNFKCLLVCFGFMGNLLYAQEPIKKYPSLLWEISGPGITKPSYLYGTMHVSSKLAFHLGDSFFMALNNCDVVALESDPSQWLTQMLDSAYLEEAGGLYRSSSGYSDFYRDAFRIEELDKRMISSSLNISGRMMNGMLYRHSGSNTDFEEDTYLDMYIFQAGKKWNKTVIGLEDFLESERMVRLSQLPDDDEDDRPVNKDYRKMIRSGKSPAEQLEDAYRNEDLDMVDSIQRIMSPSKNHQKYMLQLRNEVMANAMDSIIKLNKSIFSGIGAAHLAGNNGVIELLRAKGYTVRPVTRLIGEVSKDYREKLEKTYITHPLTTFTTADEWMSVKLPGDLVELPSNGDYKIYLYPDMANGTIYSLVRLKHHTHLLNQKSSYIIKRIDSLLYENIPGKIISQKDISQNGYPGFDIVNRSKKGNYERYRILVTPIEIVIFKVGGTLDFLKDNNNLDAVFNTFQIQSNQAAWKTVSSTFGFNINMPGIPFLEEKNKLLTPLLNTDVQILGYDTSNNYYSLKRVGLHDYEYIEEDTFELSYLANEFNTSLKLEGVSRFWDSVSHHPALRISAKDSVGFLHSMYVIDGPRYYQILAKTSDSLWPSAYFNSFKITQAQNNTSRLFVDSFAFYSVNTTTKPAGWSTFRVLETKQKLKEEDDSYLGNSLTRTFCNTKSDEQVSVEYQQFPKYYFCPTYDSLWRLLKEEYVVSGLLVKQETISRDSNVYDIVLGDTNSAREIVTRYIVNNNVLYTLQTVVDQNEFEQSPFLSQFWSTFTPNTDTVLGLPFNQNKADVFLNDLLRGDSLIQVHAINSLYQIDFENHHAPELISLVESYKNPEFTLENRIALIEELGQLKHKAILPYLNLVYHRCIDTPQLQMAVLQALVYHKSHAANKQFKELLDSETPLVSEYLVGSLFGSMYDSLEIYKDMFPFLLRFTPYPEYKFNLYGLMAAMLDSGVIKPIKYKKYKNELVREAKDALKRLMATGLAEDLYSDEYGDMGYDEESSESHISAFNTLLIPFKSDKNVQEYFNRTRRLNSEEDLFLSSILFLKEGISVNDTIWPFFANNDDYRIRLYRGLEKLNKLNLMPDSTKTQKMMAQAFLYAGVYLESNDSIHLVRKLIVETKKGSGYLYVFKRKDNYNDKLWKFDVIGALPLDSSIIPKSCETRSLGFEYIDDEEMDKKLDDILKTVKYADRERVKVKGRRYDEMDYGY